ncbi:hypothetical protein BDE18_3346 [Paracoccus pantotrophus]|uniref:Uncharacterized protein n=1 Tax=Paracoccus pantotrophus TaxID=82367 RepID=A0AAE6NRM1_PARPN|nr:hypothetical protein [Paracoccus pantotrophus]QFG35306.1 hypothetical protein ESD82_03705 [Paracoccus pantotrophus]RKS44498.1 hypothetical protein BDE18_3346 [Paracoccus pantotrophus]
MRTHRDRHGNAYRAGAREAVGDFLADLLALTPPSTHDDLKRLARNVLARPKYRRIPKAVPNGGSDDA